MKEKKRTAPFPSHLKSFARTLHFHSPAAYEMVRRSFMKCLPCTETLNHWSCTNNYKPGVSEEIITHVSNIVKSEAKKNKNLVFIVIRNVILAVIYHRYLFVFFFIVTFSV